MEEAAGKWVHSDEVLEELQSGGLSVLQKQRGYRFGLDSVLLADFADVAPTDTVADLGCGSGVLMLLLSGRGKGARYHGLEKQADIADMARRCVEMNGLSDKMTIHFLPVEQVQEALPMGTADAVICNPPYFQYKHGSRDVSPDGVRSAARMLGKEGLAPFMTAAYTLLKGKGRMFVVFPAEQLLLLTSALERAALTPKRMQLVYTRPQAPAKLVLMEARKDARAGLTCLPPLVVEA